MTKRQEDIFEILCKFPWWVSFSVALIVYSLLGFIFPYIADTSENPSLITIFHILSNFAWLFAAIFLMPIVVSLLRKLTRKELLDNQVDIKSIRKLEWKEFEYLVGEMYRRLDYHVIENEYLGADGGVDLSLKKDNKLYLVQCKQWRSRYIGVKVVREMFGVLTAENAHKVIIITSTYFSKEARAFAKKKPIELIDGDLLAKMVSKVKVNPEELPPQVEVPTENIEPNESITVAAVETKKSNPAPEQEEPKHPCPKCGSPLVLREAKKGKNAGKKFYGCSTYPKCRHTEPACPKCDSLLVLRTAKKGEKSGHEFYGCSSFPKCRHTQEINES